MEHKRRTQVERSRASREALVVAGRRLFGARGYGAVGTGEIVAAAGLTRGALYHQFADKTALFVAVLERTEEEITAHVGQVLEHLTEADPLHSLVAGAEAWLDACAAPDVQRIVLVDGPAVLGWERWRAIGRHHGLGLTVAALEQAMAAGAITPQPVPPLAHVLVGALDEAAMFVARADDPTEARADVGRVLRRLVRSLAA
ncbi:TetR/AcrR family transcriptional regulator [Blastococcus sp. SYSU D01042]